MQVKLEKISVKFEAILIVQNLLALFYQDVLNVWYYIGSDISIILQKDIDKRQYGMIE